MEVTSAQEKKLRELYDHHKRIITQWEVAFFKSNGKKPTREDMHGSPTSVRESYLRYCEIKRVLTNLQEASAKSQANKSNKFVTPLKIFGKFPTRGDVVRGEQTPSPKRLTRSSYASGSFTPSPSSSSASVERRPIFYNRMSSKLFSAASCSALPPAPASTSESEGYESQDKDKEGSQQSQDMESERNSEVEHFSILKTRKSQLFSRTNSYTERKTSKVSAISQFFGSDHGNGESPARGNSVPNLRQVDNDWLTRCDQELMDTTETNTGNTETVLNSDSEPLPLSADTGIAIDLNEIDMSEMISSIDKALASDTPSKKSTAGAVFDTQDCEYTGILGGESEDSGVVSYESIMEIMDEISKSTTPSKRQRVEKELEPILLDPTAFEPVELATTPKKRSAKTPTKSPAKENSNLYAEPEVPEEEEEEDSSKPKRKFFKSKRATIIEPPLRAIYKPKSPKKDVAKKGVFSTAKSLVSPARASPRVLGKKNANSESGRPRARVTRLKSNSTFAGDDEEMNEVKSASTRKNKKSSVVSKTKKKQNSKAASSSTPDGPSTSAGPCNDRDNIDSDIFDQVGSTSSGKGKGKGRKFRRPRMTKDEFQQMKIKTGRVSENFVRIDVSRKVFVRGRKKMTGAKMKRMEWKARKTAASREAKIKVSKCHKCGDIGHFAKYCLQDQTKDAPDDGATDDSPFPTLQEAARMVFTKSSSMPTNRVSVYETDKPVLTLAVRNPEPQQAQLTDVANQDQMDLSSMAAIESDLGSESESQLQNSVVSINQSISATAIHSIDPILSGGSLTHDESLKLSQCLNKFGFESFRPGQYEAIVRTLSGQSTLVILSTGTGKSLCYQLPAYMYSVAHPGSITLCVSPLVSLMEDQVAALPPFLHAACLHTMMTTSQKENVLEKVKKKKLHILIVSPEAVCSGLFGLLRDVDSFPPVAFACIDEVHCVSEWSHNFRPSYLKLCKILQEKLKVRTILGLTATATNRTSLSICEQLGIDPITVIRGEIIPDNLYLSVSRDQERDEALIYLLSEGRFKTCDSIIIYCTRREECERISTLIRTKIQHISSGISKPNQRQRISNSCEAYHAGMSGTRRRLVQNSFMAGKIRIVVATVAFGMGIDKSDIRAVIHYNMPKTFESYVQEIGRAGRDGLRAHCHLFLDNIRGRDLSELKRHVYVNSVDRATVRKLVRKVFRPCKCAKIESLKAKTTSESGTEVIVKKPKGPCPGHEVSFSVAGAALDLDLPEENIETLLCYLELDPKRRWVESLPKCYQLCKIQSYGGSRLLKTAAQQCPAIAVAIAIQTEKKKFKEGDTYLEFNLIDVAATVGWSSGVVRRELKRLEWSGTEFDENGNPKKFRKSGLMVEFSDLAHRMISPGDLTEEEYDAVLNLLHGRNLEQERTQLYQLDRVHQALLSVSTATAIGPDMEFNEEKCEKLKKFVYEYFHEGSSEVPPYFNSVMKRSEKEEDIRRDARSLLLSNQDVKFTGRAIARIFQGISSPCFPREHWCRSRAWWRRYLDVDFHFLNYVASQEVIAFQ